MNGWSIQTIWNESLQQKRKPIKPIDRIWAGSIGKNFYDRYQRMMGVKHTNPFDDRTLRKFAAGNFFEELIGNVFKQIGILKSAQQWLEIPANKKHLQITGKLDFLAGGLTDWNKARERIKIIEFPTAIEIICFKLIDYFQEKYPKGLEELIYEIKSVNSQVFWAKQQYLAEAYPWHIFQIYTYLKALKKPKGRIFYISKDDLTVKEIGVIYPTHYIEEKWNKDVEQMTHYYRNKIEPPKPEGIIFDKRKSIKFQDKKIKYKTDGAWVPNWEIKWSPYLTMITGCRGTDEFTALDEWLEKIKPEMKIKNDELKKKRLKKEGIEWPRKKSTLKKQPD